MMRNGITKIEMPKLSRDKVGLDLVSNKYSISNMIIIHAEATPASEIVRI